MLFNRSLRMRELGNICRPCNALRNWARLAYLTRFIVTSCVALTGGNLSIKGWDSVASRWLSTCMGKRLLPVYVGSGDQLKDDVRPYETLWLDYITKPMNKHKFIHYISIKSRQVWHLRLINNAIQLETKELVFIITNCQLDSPVDLETPALHATLDWTKHV